MKTSTQPIKIKVIDFALFDENYHYINCSRIYFSYFEAIPSVKVIGGINHKTAMKWIESNLSDQIVKKHSRQIYIKDSRKWEYTIINYVLKDSILIKVERYGDLVILFSEKSAEMAEKLLHKLKKFKKPHSSDLSTLIQDGNGLKLIDIKNKKPLMSLSGNYNEDLSILHNNIIRVLKKKNNSGLFLFHGTPGTGKSTYIRYLMHYMNKRVIFLPPKIAANLDSPNLVKILVEEPNSILVIEDAENLLTSREKGNESSISMLLNLTDGLLGESLGIQVICTFNSSLKHIDKALLRKGRLKALYEFKPLSILKSLALLEKLGVTDKIVNEPMTLADIYNIQEQQFEFTKPTRTIGFGVVA
jgi:hypothetical protein